VVSVAIEYLFFAKCAAGTSVASFEAFKTELKRLTIVKRWAVSASRRQTATRTQAGRRPD
jgi:hypothetical protein